MRRLFKGINWYEGLWTLYLPAAFIGFYMGTITEQTFIIIVVVWSMLEVRDEIRKRNGKS